MNDTKIESADKIPARAPHGCNGCASRWFGSSIAHCATCHATFGGVGGFDKHRAGTKDKTQLAGQCADPAAIGFVQNGHGTWVTPSDGVDFKAVFGGKD
jgi:hypothetical protein